MDLDFDPLKDRKDRGLAGPGGWNKFGKEDRSNQPQSNPDGSRFKLERSIGFKRVPDDPDQREQTP